MIIFFLDFLTSRAGFKNWKCCQYVGRFPDSLCRHGIYYRLFFKYVLSWVMTNVKTSAALVGPDAAVDPRCLCTEEGTSPRSRLLLATENWSAGRRADGLRRHKRFAACLRWQRPAWNEQARACRFWWGIFLIEKIFYNDTGNRRKRILLLQTFSKHQTKSNKSISQISNNYFLGWLD